LFRLAGQQPPEPRSPLAHVDPAMTYLLDVLTHTPAQVADDLLTVVAQNRAAENLLGVWTGLPGYESNVTWRWFADPASRDGNDPAEHERIGRAYVADLRAGVAQRAPGDRFAHGLVADLLDRSAEFGALWARQEVAALASAPKLIRHPLIGELDLQCDVVLSPATGHRLVLFRPRPGSNAHERIAFLDVLGNQKFA
ncbi:MmyB family transcriptional regulator, partial [Catenuloplanes niger]